MGVLLALLASWIVVPLPPAAAAPAIALSKSAPATVRAGQPITYTLTITNPASNPDAAPEWNVSLRDVLPPGVTYVGGSTSPASAGEPSSSSSAAGTVLTWTNIADVAPNGSITLTFQATPDPATYPVGSTVQNSAQAYANTDPLVEPEFDASGTVVPGTATESASATASTTISALEITKAEGSPEGELLRGVHDHPTVYTITVREASTAGSTGLVVTDFIPASIEYLGCGGEDNSSGPEYPGAPSLTATPAVPGCVQPDTVTTVVNPPPDGTTTYPPGVYTRLQWTLGNLAPGAVVNLPYAAGIPLRANAPFPIPAPLPASGNQGANLNNNTGASTREGATETSATNIARASATYSGPTAPGASAVISADARATVSIEDIRMRKSVSPGQFTAGGTATYTLTIDASEYAAGSNIVVTDTLPNGVCPLGGPGTNYATGAPAACNGSAATVPSTAYQSVTQNPNGTFTVVFAPVQVAANGTVTLTYNSRMLNTFQGGSVAGEPTAVGDSFTNHATLTATTTPIAGTGETGTATVTDESSATLSSGGTTIDKTILPRSASGGACPTTTAQYGEPADFAPAETQFVVGDLVCFALRVNYASATQTREPRVADFLPPEMTYVAGSVQSTPAGAAVPFGVTESASTLVLLPGLPVVGGRFVPAGGVTEVVFQARVTRAPPGPAAATVLNLMKLSTVDTAGNSSSFRDQLALQVLPPPPLRVVKGVTSVDTPPSGPNGLGTNVDGVTVQGGSIATFHIDVTHGGTAGSATGLPVGGIDTWDVLPAGITCADISNVRVTPGLGVAPTIACTDPGDAAHPSFTDSDTLSLLRITYDLTGDVAAQELGPGQSISVLYDMAIPDPTGVSRVFPDRAAVRSYEQATDVDGQVATYFPADNVDTTVTDAQENAPAAADASSVVVRGATVTKTGTTSITEANNNAATQATVGEVVTYRYAVTIPAGTEVYDASLTDTIPTGFSLIAPPPTLLFYPDAASTTTAPVPAGVSVNPATGAVDFGAVYQNSTATDQRFEVVLTTRVTTAAITPAQNPVSRQNTARFDSLAAPGGAPLPGRTATYTISVRQPAAVLAKTNDRPSPVPGGTLVTYTLTATDPSGTGNAARPPLHDAFITDCLPAGLTFQAYGANPGQTPTAGDGANGCAVGTTRLVWNLGDLAPGVPVTRTYTALLPSDAVAATSYTNSALLTGSSLDDNKTDPLAADNPNERAYSATDTSVVTIVGAGVAKSVTPERATIGERLTWQVTSVGPPNTTFYEGSVIDHIPAGIDDLRVESVTCSYITPPLGPCPVGTPTLLTPAIQPDGSRFAGFLFGDIPASPQLRALVITYSGRVADVPINTAGRVVTNEASARWNTTDGRTPTSADFAFDVIGGTDSASATVIEPSVTVAKAVSDATPDPAQPFTYTVTATNGSGANVSDAYNGRIVDQIPSGVVVDPASITAGGELTGADPVTGGGTITWDQTDLAGPLAPGGSVDLRYSAVLAPSANLTSAALVNRVTLSSYESLSSGGRVYAGNTATASVTPQFPRLVTAKAAVDPAPAYIGDPFTWRVTVTNTGTAPAFGVDVNDVLPAGWDYVDGSAVVTVAGGAAEAIEPVQLGRILRWANLGSLNPGESVVVTFQAEPTDSVVDDPGVGSTVPQVNTAQGGGVDASGAPGNADGGYGRGQATAQTRIDAADLTVAKTHDSPVVAGSELHWHVVATNLGADAAVGQFTVTDTLPAGVGFVSAGGTGWSCSLAGATLTCTRLNPAETLASGASLPTIDVVVDVPAGTASGTELTNSASVAGRTFDPDLTNNAASDTATVTTSADLQVTKAHALDPLAGERATWTIDLVNNGPSVAQPNVTITDTLPAGVTFVSATGTGWDCSASGQQVTCTRDAVLPLGSAPQVTLVVDVAPSATGTLTNTASVTSPTPDPNTGNNTDTDPTPIRTLADLSIEKTHVGPFVAGASGSYDLVVSNAGPSDAQSVVRITDTLPAGLTFTSSTDVTGSWTCSATGQDLTCDLSGDLAAGDQAAVRIHVDIDPDQGTDPILNAATVASPTPDPIQVNNTDDDNTAIGVLTDLRIVKSHTGTAVAGETFDWTLVVSNHGPSSTPGPLTVTDAVPAGTAYVSATGAGWTCSETGGLVTCTRPDGLAAGTPANGVEAPPITLTVRVLPSSGPGTITNVADVDGPQPDLLPANNTDTDSAAVVDQADIAVTKDRVGTGPVAAGDTVAFDVTVTNNGPSDADAVVLSDTLPPGMTAVSVTPPSGQGWSCGGVGRLVRCERATFPAAVPPPTSSVIRVVARVASSVPDGTQLTNTAVVSTSTPGDDPANNSDDATITVAARADLRITKTHDPSQDPVTAGTQATFTIRVTNAGLSDALGPITVTDTLPAGIAFVAAAAPWACTPGAANPQVVTCVHDGNAGLPAGGSTATLVMTVAVDAAADAGNYVNTATVDSPTTDPDTSNNTDTDTLPVVQVADLSITKTHAGQAHIGDDLTFTVVVSNAGPSEAREVVVRDPLPTGLTFVSATGSGWTCAQSGGVVQCELAGPLAPGASAEPIEVVATVDPKAYPSVDNTATTSSETPDEDPSDNSATDTVDVPPLVDLSIVKTHDGSLTVGQQAAWTLTVSNAGPTDDPGPLTVVDTLPTGLTYVSATGDGWTCSASGQLVTCTSAGGLDVAATSELHLVTQVEPTAYPSVVNAGTVTSGAEDGDPENNTATDPADVIPLSRLGIAKDVVGQVNQRVTYRIVATNLGPNATTSAVVVTDPLPEGLSLVSVSGPGWTCATQGDLANCQYQPPLAVGDAAPPLTVVADVTAATGAEVVNVARVDGGQVDPCPECWDTDGARIVVPTPEAAGAGPGLSYTGIFVWRLLALALLLAATGVALVTVSRRRGPVS